MKKRNCFFEKKIVTIRDKKLQTKSAIPQRDAQNYRPKGDKSIENETNENPVKPSKKKGEPPYEAPELFFEPFACANMRP